MALEPEPKKMVLNYQRQAKYLARALQVMPSSTSSLDTSRLTIGFFCISGLDILGVLDQKSPEERTRMITWIKGLYNLDKSSNRAAFHGGTFLKTSNFGFLNQDQHLGHVAMTYTALASLKILGDDLSDFDSVSLARGLQVLQKSDGSFNSSNEGGENDMRFVFCACAVSHFINNWSGINIDKATEFIVKSITYEGSIAVAPDCEGHGGSTYCGVASLKLMGTLDRLTQRQRRRLITWCLNRLSQGFSGRPNKPDDTCYSFWIGATIKILKPFEDVETFIGKSSNFVLETQDDIKGGLAKWIDNPTDPLHTYLGLGGLALSKYPGLCDIDPGVNISMKALS